MKKFLVLLLVLACMPLFSGIHAIFETKDLAPGSEANQMEMFLEGSKLKVVMTNGANKNTAKSSDMNVQAVMIDMTSKKMQIVNDKKKEVLEIDFEQVKAMMEAVKPQLKQAQEQMEKAMASMPPEQRAQMEKMMKGKMGGMNAGAAEEIKWETKKSGKSERISGYKCDNYEVFGNNEKKYDAWVANPKELKLSDADIKSFYGMVDFSKEMADSLKDMFSKQGKLNFSSAMSAMRDIKGIPIKTTVYLEGKAHSESSLKEMKSENFSDSVFAIPADYKRTNPMKMK